MNRFVALVCIFLACVVSACGVPQDEKPTSVLALQANQVTAPKVPSPALFSYQAQPYIATPALDPFNSQRLTLAHKKEWQAATAQSGLLASELKRNKENLEAFALESITLVGHMSSQGRQVALVKVDGLVYSVQQGSYMGQNLGRVTAMNDRSLSLRELVQDPAGQWIERKVTLVLQERLK